jgi:fructokinase
MLSSAVLKWLQWLLLANIKMNNQLNLLSIGDASWDVFINPSESEALCEIDNKKCLICFKYGEKIPVKTLDFSVGGNAANNAVGTKRLGINSAAVLTLGLDEIGNQIVGTLKKEGVDVNYVIQQPATTSNYSTAINYSGERTIFTYKAPRSYEFPVKLPVTPWVYLTSMGDSFQPFYNHLVAWLKLNPTVKLAFNPGGRQIKAGLEAIKEVLNLTQLIFVNREEAESLTGFKASQGQEKELLQKLSSLGPKICVVTNGPAGSFLFDGQHYFKAGTFPIDAYERTGAGDSFGSGVLAAIMKGKSLQEALLWGSANSASVISYVGAQKGLLTETDMAVWMKRAESSKVEMGEF